MTPPLNANITDIIIALGSNLSDESAIQSALTTTLTALHHLGDVVISPVVVGKDFTHKTELIYHNWVVSVALHQKIDKKTLDDTLKNIEKSCGRTTDDLSVVMDLDLLAYDDDGWIIIQKRLPFKTHEKMGLLKVAPFLLQHKLTK